MKVREILEAKQFADSKITSKKFVECARKLAQDKRQLEKSPELASQLSKIKSAGSKVPPMAAILVLETLELDPTMVFQGIWRLHPVWFSQAFAIDVETPEHVRRFQKKLSEKKLLFKEIDVLQGVETLMFNARKGSPQACRSCAKIAHFLVQCVNNIFLVRPELFRDYADFQPVWPILKSQQPFYGQTKMEEERILKDVGKEYHLWLAPSGQTNPRRPATWIAGRLFQFMKRAKEGAKRNLKTYPNLLPEDDGYQRKWIRHLANLPEFNSDNDYIWWRLAKLILEVTYPEPEICKAFAKLSKSTKKNESGKVADMSPKAHQEAIRAIEHAFEALAPRVKNKTKVTGTGGAESAHGLSSPAEAGLAAQEKAVLRPGTGPQAARGVSAKGPKAGSPEVDLHR